MPLKKGPFHLAIGLEMDIVIVLIVGSNRLFRPGSFFPRKGTIFVKFVDKIPYSSVAHLDHN